METEVRVCSKCHLELPTDQFTVTDKASGKRRAHCRVCESARVRTYYAANPDYRAKTAANSAKWQKANPVKAARIRRNRDLRRKYDLSQSQYEALLVDQNGECALCGAQEHGHRHFNGRLARLPGGADTHWPIDHDHVTNIVRGILCHNCNTTLGGYEALLDKVGEAKLLDYLTRPSPVIPPAPPPPDIRATARFVADLPPRYTHGNCEVCGEAQHAGGLCFKHYMRKRRTGDAGGIEPRPKGTLKGGTHYKTVLTEEQAREIKFSTEKGVVLAARYGVKPAVVSSIRLGLTWKHIEQDAA